MTRINLKIIFGFIAMALVVVLTIQLIKMPTFMFPSVYLTALLIIAILVCSLIVSALIKLIFKKTPFLLILSTIVSVVSIFFMYKFYSPTLTIIVPKGYEGDITLFISDSDKNILNVDSNGIGYINKKTFDKVYTKPIVLETDGTDISNQAVGFNSTTFWAKGSSSKAIHEGYNTPVKEVNFLSFEIVR